MNNLIIRLTIKILFETISAILWDVMYVRIFIFQQLFQNLYLQKLYLTKELKKIYNEDLFTVFIR